MKRLKGRVIVAGRVEGLALVSSKPISFYGGVNPENGEIVERGHMLKGVKVSGKILVFPYGRGSSVGVYVLYAMAKYGTAPKAIINVEAEPVVASGCILAEIPLLDRFDVNPLVAISTGDKVKILEDGIVEVSKSR
jgi:hypothetical protein